MEVESSEGDVLTMHKLKITDAAAHLHNKQHDLQRVAQIRSQTCRFANN